MIPRSVHRRPRPHFPLSQLLKQRQVTQYELAKRSKLSTTYINRLCLGKQAPGWSVLCILADALGLSLGDFHPAKKAG